MITYLLKSGLCLLLLLAIYRLLLEKEKMFHFNRIFLLFSLVFSFCAPLIPIPNPFHNSSLHQVFPAANAAIEKMDQAIAAPNPDTAGAASSPSPVNAAMIVTCIYGVIALAFGFRFVRNLLLITLRIRKHEQIRTATGRLVLIPEQIVTHSFLNYIFVNKTEYEQDRLEQEVLVHEQAHVRQRHTLDVIFIELLQVVCWFNPILILYRHAIQLNHEFLADAAAAGTAPNLRAYQYLLLNKISLTPYPAMTSPLNYTITKKRLLMITKTSSRKTIRLRVAAVCTLIIVSLFFVSSPGNAQNLIGVVIRSQRTIDGTQELGEHPYVEIDKKQASSDMLEKISPSCISSSTILPAPQSVKKYGRKAADGAVILTTNKKGITYVTPTESENIAKERGITAGFFHRVTLKKEDGTTFDKLIIIWPDGKGRLVSWGGPTDKVAIVIGNRLFTEDQASEAEAYLQQVKAHVTQYGTAGKDLRIPGLDLSSYDKIFHFTIDSTQTVVHLKPHGEQ